jgi:hypothetical protein
MNNQRIKIPLDDMEVMKKRRLQQCNYYVCCEVEAFSCEAVGMFVGGEFSHGTCFGVSKKEDAVSRSGRVNGFMGNFNGGS